jgi:GNAT superfamily N-acetyltransferase
MVMTEPLALPGQATLLACWAALAQISHGARVIRSATTSAAVFPDWTPLNNAILLDTPDRATAAASRLAHVYASAGVDAWALWLPSEIADLDAADRPWSEVAGLTRDTTTLVMRTTLPKALRRHTAVVSTSIKTATRAGETPIPVAELEPSDGVPDLFAWVLVHDGVAVSGAWSFLHLFDCGVYAVETLPEFRRRGFARALVEHVLAEARARGARTASLQSTRAGQPLYETLGFTAAGRYEEWASAGPALNDHQDRRRGASDARRRTRRVARAIQQPSRQW